MEETVEDIGFKLTEKYNLTSDGTRNIVLLESYGKRTGKGASAPLSGEIGYKPHTYYSSIEALVNGLIRYEIISSVSEVKDLKELIEHIDKTKEEIYTYFNEKITLNLMKIKDLKDTTSVE